MRHASYLLFYSMALRTMTFAPPKCMYRSSMKGDMPQSGHYLTENKNTCQPQPSFQFFV